jgi:hypothetical protein
MCRHLAATPSNHCVSILRWCDVRRAMTRKSDGSAPSGFAFGYAVTSCAFALKLRCLNIGIGKISCSGSFGGIFIGLEADLEDIELITASNFHGRAAIGTDSHPRAL